MARTSTASSRSSTKKASSATKSAARKSSGSAKKSAGDTAKKSSSSAKKSTSSAKKTSASAKKTASSAKKTGSAAKQTASSAGRTVGNAANTAAGSAKKATRSATSAVKKAAGSAQRATSGAARKSTSSAKRSSSATKGRGSSSRSSRSSQRPDALQVLIDDHRTVEQLFKRFEKSGSNADQARAEIAERVIEELSVHAVVEEQAFYPAVRQLKNLEDEVLEALEEHHVVKWVLSELEKMNPSDERFEAKFTVMMENVRHHVEEEENDMFKKVRRAMSREQLESLGVALLEAKQVAPTRPHPRAPDTPPGNMIAGALSAPIDAALNAGKNAVDAVRDFARGND